MGSGEWDGTPRATVPSPKMVSSPDVVSASTETAEHSPFPFGLGICSAPQDSSPPSPLPLFYVSPAASAARSEKAHVQNAAGVRSGWYALARPNETFNVRISLVNDTRAGTPKEDYACTELYVDGMSTNSHKVFCYCSPRRERVQDGFNERDVKGEGFGYQRYVRPFVFRSAAADAPAAAPTSRDNSEDVGTICLDVYVGEAVRRDRSQSKNTRQYEALPSGNVSEKAAAKEGRSLRASTHGLISKMSSLSTWTTNSKRLVEAAGVEIFVREHSWLRSRRIIDDAGVACTAARYRMLLRQDCPRPLAGTAERDAKKAKTLLAVVKTEAAQVGDAQPAPQIGVTAADVVDLT